MLVVNAQIQIPDAEFEFTFVRSSGPGGQNVNKVNTKAVLRWCVMTSRGLPDGVRERVLARFRSRITAEGELILTSQRYRDQSRNQQDCLEKLRAMLVEAAHVPKPRKKTRISRAAKERRLKDKRETSRRKAGRSDSSRDD